MKPSCDDLEASGRNIEKVDFLGFAFDPLNAHQAQQEICLLANGDQFSYVVTPNVDHAVRLDIDPDQAIADAYRMASLTLCDSRILSLLARISGVTLAAVPGSDLTRDLLQTNNQAWRCAMIGGNPELHVKIQQSYLEFDWIFFEPPMGVRDDPQARLKIAEFIENASANIIFFAIGAPQSEITCHEIATRGKASGVALCVGASLEFLAGVKSRAPSWMQQLALEWLYRLASEPKRLWRRYLREGPAIFAIWWRWHRLTNARLRDGSDSIRFGGK